jgi:hypothetical protein
LDLAETGYSVQDLTVVKIIVTHQDTALHLFADNSFSLSNDKKVIQHIIL